MVFKMINFPIGLILLSLFLVSSCAPKKTPEKNPNNIISHAKPYDYGVSNTQYRVAESNFYLKKSLKKAPINTFAHQRNIVNVKTQQVIREAQDVLYSSAVVDVTKGATITVPEFSAYSVVQVIDMQNYSITTIYAGQSKTINLKDVSYGHYVYLNGRTNPMTSDKNGLINAHKQQDALIIQANSSIPYTPPKDLISDEKMLQIRAALFKDVAQGKIKDFTRLMGTKDFVDEQGHLYASAYGWGGLPIYDAGYLPIINNISGNTCSSLTIDEPPVNYAKRGFWSITTYNKRGWLAKDKAALSNDEVKANGDGTYTIHFNCEAKINNINTIDAFAVLMRIYTPTNAKDISQYLKHARANYAVKEVNFDVNDPSDWPIDLASYGYTPETYAQAETYTFMRNFINRVGVNNFFHFKALATKDDHWVVSPNNDVLYSLVTIDASDDFTLIVPKYRSDRLMSIQIIDGNHFTTKQFYGAGKYFFPKGTFNTKQVVLGVRVEVDGTNQEEMDYIVKNIQPKMKIIAKSNHDWVPEINHQSRLKLRKALVHYYDNLKNSFGGMTQNAQQVKNLWFRMLTTAGAWGLSEDKHAMYIIYAPKLKAKQCYTATYKVPRVDAFWSVTVYGEDKFLISNNHNTINKYSADFNDDGTFTVYFGSQQQCGNVKNRLNTVDNWNLLLRAYKPDVQAFKNYQIPEVKLIN